MDKRSSESRNENDVYTIPGVTYLCQRCGKVHPVDEMTSYAYRDATPCCPKD